MKIVVLLLFCSVLVSVVSFKLEDPGEVGVNFGDSTPAAQLVYVDENNEEGRVKIVLITEVQGTLQININSNNKDVIDIVQEDGPDSSQFYLTAKLLDYETLISEKITPNFPVDVIENGDLQNKQTLSVNIVNIDDESPTLSTSACTIKENTTVDVASSQCEFTVSDPDGWLATMDYSNIVGTNGEKDLFEFQYKDTPANNVYESPVYLVLKEGQVLDYESTILYTFHVEATDNNAHSTSPLSSVPVIVQVEDVSDEPPRWDSGFKSAITVPEKTATTIAVSATDGDVGINNDINYKITETSHDFVSINKETGEITVEPINRDTGDGKNDQVVFTVQAYEVPDEDSFIEGTITLIIEDKDDNVAKITVDGFDDKVDLTVDENIIDLNLNINANDIDLGENAIYTANLTFTGGVDYSSCFTIIPGRGYESTNLALTILDPSKLDYEDPDWRVISMELLTIGTKTTDNIDKRTITITLNDINDEVPIFEPTEYTAQIYENATVGTFIEKIQATDADQEDIDAGLKHELIGSLANSILAIEDLGGDVTTIIDNAFDFEKQEEVTVQVRASDKGNHQTTAQLTITVLDVNDEDPRMVVSSSITVAENQADGFELATQISASDEDRTADLNFSIDWTNSYATKNSQRLKQEVFDTIQCVDVETVPNPDTTKVTAKLTIKETQSENTPDFELFDNLYIQLVVSDQNTEQGDGTDSALIVISIQDVNDNAPVFPEGTETVTRRVTENAANGTVITSPVATDGDVGDKLVYSIESAEENTPIEWVAIDENTGIITVNYLTESDQIDCDEPKRDDLKYNVSVTDGNYTTTVTITIEIIDTNDNFPTMGDVSESIDETPDGDTSANGNIVVKLEPADKDRDEAYSTVLCTFATSVSLEVTRRFEIDSDNNIKVSLAEGVNLDRETQAQFVFDLNCYDDPQRQGTNSNPINPPPKVTITLKDINDNPPTIKNTEITGTINENSKKDTVISLEGSDKDEENNPNSEIEFLEIIEIKRFINIDHDTPEENTPQDLFVITTGENNEGILTVNYDNLEGYYGYLVSTISLTDKGEPPLTNQVDVTIEVAKYNFEEPKFSYPDDGETIYLQTTQTPNAALIIFNGIDNMENIKASDQQGGKFVIKFELVEDTSGDEHIFRVFDRGNSEAQLQVTTDTFDRKAYTLTISAFIPNDGSIQGSAAFAKNVTITIDFFDQDATDPIFTEHAGSADFKENTNGLTFTLPKANYSKSDLPEDLPVYYLIKEGDTSLFELDSKSGVLTLKQELDYEKTESYDLVIQSSNGPAIKPTAVEDTKYNLTINVVDANDNPPVFEEKSYIGMMLTISDSNDRTVATVKATDIDTTSTDKLIYTITKTTGSNDILSNLGDAFKVGSSTGTIEAIFARNADYKGYFTLEVTVKDEAPESHTDTTEAKIYLVTDDNLVKFTFEDDLDTVAALKDNITVVLNDVFQNFSYVSNVQDPQKNDPVDDSPRTTAPVYFVSTIDNAPLLQSEIYTKVTNTNFFRQMRTDFASIGLTLVSFDTTTTLNDNLEATLQAWLIGVAVVLGSLCLILLIAFILKTRALNQRIDKLSNTKFGSQESGLNRTGVAAPTTNKHAVEGSNPVYNNDVDTKDIDRRSVTSGDSDLIGVEDDDKFNYDDSMSRENVIE